MPYFDKFGWFLIYQEILGSGTSEAEAEILECVLKHMCRNTRDHEYEAEKTTSHRKRWLALRLGMDGYNASLCHTSWLTSLGCTAGKSISQTLSHPFFFFAL